MLTIESKLPMQEPPPKKVMIGFRTDKSIHTALKQSALENKTSIAKILEDLAVQYLKGAI
jgi:hypothetical protein